MNLPNKITLARIISTPFFLGLFVSLSYFPQYKVAIIAMLWVLFVLGEFSDVLDGYIARKYNMVSDLGKLMDPFADVISRVTNFMCFLWAGIMPIWIFAIILYRELGITFLRMMMLGKGTAQAARLGGKIKAVFYFLSGVVGLLYYSLIQLAPQWDYVDGIKILSLVIFSFAALGAVLSFVDYVKVFLSMKKK